MGGKSDSSVQENEHTRGFVKILSFSSNSLFVMLKRFNLTTDNLTVQPKLFQPMRKSLLTGSGVFAHLRSKTTGLLAAAALLGSNPMQAQYCAAGPTTTFDTDIYNVVLNGDVTSINNATGCVAALGTLDYTAQSADVTQGGSYALIVEGNSCSGFFYGGYVRAWVDWNDDFIFDNATESLGQYNYSFGPNTDTINFTVPGAPVGPHRMRVLLSEAPISSGCATYPYGSAHDYTLYVNASACPPPAVMLGTVSSSSVPLMMSGSGSYEIEYGPVGFGQGTGTVLTGIGSPYTVFGLSANQSYDFYVRQVCAGPLFSGWTKISATTPCAAYMAPYIEDVESVASGLNGTFPGTVISNCWELASTPSGSGFVPLWETETGPGSDNNSSSTGPWYDHTLGGVSGGKYFYLETSGGTFGDSAKLTSPLIDISALTNPALGFYYHMYGADINQVRIDVYSGGMWHNGVSSIVGEQQSSGTDAWEQAVVALGAYSGVIRVRFVGFQGGSFRGDISIDDISIDEAPACPPATGISVSLDGAGNAVFSWAPNGITEIEIEYGPDGFLQGTGTIATATGNPATLAGGFSILNKYSFYVRFKCDSVNYSTWSGRIDVGGYCEGGPSNTADTDPQDVILNGESLSITNLATCPGQLGVVDFTAQTADLRQAKTYSVTVTYGSCSSSTYDGFGSVWIDWNADAVFDPSELIGATALPDSVQPLTVNYTFSVPVSAAIGSTRMRVMQHEAAPSLPLDPCASFVYGGVEDYSIEVLGCDRPIVLNAIVTKSPFCAGATGELKAAHSGGVGAKTYLWSNGAVTKFTSGPAGTYWVTVTDVRGCSATDTVTMTDPAGVQYATTLINVVRSGSNFTVTWNPFVAGPGVTHLGYRVGWRVRNSGAPFVTSPLLGTGVTSYVANLTGYCSANYEFVVYVRYNLGGGGLTSAPSCSISRGLPIGTPCKDFVDGTEEADAAGYEMAVYPNPTMDVTYLSAPRGTTFELTDLQGRVLETGVVSDAEAALDLSGYAQGVYLLKATFEGEVRVERVVRR